MVIGWVSRAEEKDQDLAAMNAWQRVEMTQNRPGLPCLLVPQPAHAVLAGDLAEALLPSAFGELPREIKQSIMMHDTGWAMLDAAQIQSLRSAPAGNGALPVPFTGNSAEQMVEAWTASINSVERFSTAGGLIVSRHFVSLAKPAHAEYRRFLDAERARQRRLEAKQAASAADLARWASALAFCDLLSLYLLTGLRIDTNFPLARAAAHSGPSRSEAALRFEGDRLRFTPAVFEPDAGVALEALRHPVAEGAPRTEKLTWVFA
ncbi:MAG TPA: DUF3891 family protein [Acidobacteriaceae bacterium]|nr:DUF3891 family protein [Acidobacteriaceae bacterium]